MIFLQLLKIFNILFTIKLKNCNFINWNLYNILCFFKNEEWTIIDKTGQ